MRIWITWEDQRRNRELSKALGAKLIEMKEIDQIKNYFIKYGVGITKTLITLFREKPSLVFCQNPSLVLSFFLILIKRFFGFKVIVDAHNAGIFPAEGHSRILMMLSAFIQRHADLVLVTNNGLLEHVHKNNSKAFVLQDKIPEINAPKKYCILKGTINILFICSYASDEPYKEVFDAATGLSDDVCLYVTGNYKNRNITPANLPANIIFTGFIPQQEFEEILYSVDATIDLTSRENCLVCGAYESVAAEKPMILSDTLALKEYFNIGAVYTSHNAPMIHNAINELISHKDVLTEQVKRLKVYRMADWEKNRESLELYIAGIQNN